MTGSTCWSTVPALRGNHVALEPLRTEHADGLRAALDDGALSQLWYTGVPAPDKVETYVASVLEGQEQGKWLPLVVRDAAGEIVGATRYYDLDTAVPRLQIGYTWYATRVHRTGLNTEAKLLLLTHAFETMGCACVGFETSWFNHASRAAILRLGARQDGVLRNHRRHSNGSLRDTVVFSIIGSEWEAVKSHLMHKLAQGESRHG